jgi:galactokinase
MNTKETVLQAFHQRFGTQPDWIVRTPGRVNLIGDHTDYNNGFVLPMAIDRSVWIALRRRSGNQVILQSLDFKETLEFDLKDFRKQAITWEEYVKGVAWTLRDEGLDLSAWEGVVAGDIPVASGLSSSAALELAVARAFAAAANWPWQPKLVARLMQKAENEWVGVASGIMDPLISAVAEAGKAALIDCGNLEIAQVAIPSTVAVVIMNTMKPRGLVDSAYNERRQQCETAAQYFGVRSLREVNLEDLTRAEGNLDEIIFKRARHVLSENDRVLHMAKELENNDPVAAGKLMKESHFSLRDDFEVSCTELDQIVAAAIEQPACFGARMTGAGFGGCAVALVKVGTVDGFIAMVTSEYQRRVGITPQFLVSSAAAGAGLESVS